LEKIKRQMCLLALALCLFAAGCGKAQPEAFDERLAGVWRLVEETHNGAEAFSIAEYLYFLHDGRFYSEGAGLFSYWDAREFALELPRVNASDGETDLIHKALMFTQALLEASTMADVPSIDLSKFPLKTAYTLEDIGASLDGANDGQTANYFAKYDNDKLTLRITGSYGAGNKRVDSVLVYEREYPIIANAAYFRPALAGDWTDSEGRQWQFYFEEESEGIDGFRFTMTEGGGADAADVIAYSSADIRAVRAESWDVECIEWIAFRFEGWELSGRMVAFDERTLRINDGAGSEWVLTRDGTEMEATEEDVIDEIEE